MQTDPIGYADGMNWYNYVGSDPVNFVDPLGLYPGDDPSGYDGPPIIVVAHKVKHRHHVVDSGTYTPPVAIPRAVVSKPQKEEEEEKEEEPGILSCAKAVGGSAAEGFLDPTAVIFGTGKATLEARNRVGAEDYGSPKYRTVFKRSLGSAVRIGLKRFIPGYLQASAVIGGVKGVFTLASDPRCGIEMF